MKKLTSILSAFILLSCNSNSINKEIIGNWEIVEFKTMNMKIDGDLARSEKIALSIHYTFMSDSTINIRGDVQGNVVGNYLIENDSLFLRYKLAERDANERFKIIDFTKNRMILEQSFVDWGDLNFVLNKVQE